MLPALLSCAALATPIWAQQAGTKEMKDGEAERKGDVVRAGDSDNVDPIKNDATKMGDKNIVTICADSPDFSILVSAVKAAGLDKTLSGDGLFTIFAPNNDAFKKIPQDTLDELMKPENKERLSAILQAHVVKGIIKADVLRNMEGNTANETDLETETPAAIDGDIAVTEKDSDEAEPGTIEEDQEVTQENKAPEGDSQINRISMAGSTLEFTFEDGNIMVDGAKIIKSEMIGTNGVIHVIDSVLIPVQPE